MGVELPDCHGMSGCDSLREHTYFPGQNDGACPPHSSKSSAMTVTRVLVFSGEFSSR